MPGVEGPNEPTPEARCPWCSALIPAGSASCPSCHAALVDHTESASIPGVTSVDPTVIAEEAAARRAFERARDQSRYSAGRTIGMLAGGPLGAVLGGAIESALVNRQPGSTLPPGAVPATFEGLRQLDARFAPAPTATGVTYPGVAGTPGYVGELRPAPHGANELEPARSIDAAPAAEPAARPGAQPGAGSAPSPSAPGPLADPWVDLPAPPIADRIAGTQYDPWATQPIAEPPLQPDPANDPWAVGGGPWSQDLWAQTNRQEGDRKPR